MAVCAHCSKELKKCDARRKYCSRACKAGHVIIPVTPGWNAIPGFAFYEANAEGEIRIRGRKSLVAGRQTGGYLGVTARDDRGRMGSRTIHRLICLAFHGKPPSRRHHAAHRDGNRANNRADNLRWRTPKQNTAEMIIHGTKRFGEHHGSAKLTEAQVKTIRSRHASTVHRYGLFPKMAKEFGVSIGCLQDIIYGRRWSHK